METDDSGHQIIPQLISVILNNPGPSHNVEITEIKEESCDSEHSMETILVERLMNGKLTYNDYTTCIGDDVDDSEEDDDNKQEDERNVAPQINISTQSPSQKRKRIRTKRSNLSPTLQGLLGEANIRWARGESEVATKICFEIIRQVPTAVEPFETLSQIYEADEPEKSLQFALIAAHLSPQNADPWIRFANMSLEKGDLKQAAQCLTKAINALPTSIELHLKRMDIYKSNDDMRPYYYAGLRLLNYLPPSETKLILEYSEIIAQGLFNFGRTKKAQEAMEILFSKCPSVITPAHVNHLMEILLANKNYEKILEILVEHCGITIEAEKQLFEDQNEMIEEKLFIISYTMPSNTPIDIRAKFVICLIRMHMFHLMYWQEIEQFTIEQSGDILFDIAEAFMQEQQYEEAFKILDKLVKTEKFSMAAVWLRHAECLQSLRRFSEAITSYKQVLTLAPQLTDVRSTLSRLLREQGRYNEAIVALEQSHIPTEEIDSQLLVQRCKLLRQHWKIREYIQDVFILISRHSVDHKLLNELKVVDDFVIPPEKLNNLKSIDDVFLGSQAKSHRRDLSIEQEWLLLEDITNIAYNVKQYDLMQRITNAALQLRKFKDYKKGIEFLHIIACIYSGDSTSGYNLIRFMATANIKNVKIWNLFNVIIQQVEENRHNRFIIRLLTKLNVDLSLRILHANNCLVSGTYKYALSEYSDVYREAPNALLALLLSVTYFQLALQKTNAKKHSLVVQGYAFLNEYRKRRGPEAMHEIYYNFGRAFHQLGAFHLAVHYYKLVLEFDSDLLQQKSRNLLHLRREAAFNLSLCYRNSEAYDLARSYIRKYIVV